jgi:hypothetical protein
VYTVTGLPPSDFGGLKLIVAIPLPAVAVTFLGGSGMRRSIGGLPVTPPAPTPPNTKDWEVIRKMAKTAIVTTFPFMKLPPAQYLLSWIYLSLN